MHPPAGSTCACFASSEHAPLQPLPGFTIESTRLGATLRASTENAKRLQAFGVNVPLRFAATYGGNVALRCSRECSLPR